jgi:hypothetical protein
MKNLLLFGWMFICSNYVISQETIEIGKNTLKPGHRYFNISEVIDARRSQYYIGSCRTGMVNKTERLLLNQPVREALQGYFTEKMPSDAALPSVALRILRFAFFESATASSETARGAIDFEVYLKTENNYQLLKNFSIRNESSGMDATKFHNDNIKAALQTMVENLRDSIPWLELSAVAKGENLAKRDLQSPFYPKIVKDSVFKTGIYQNFSEFRANAPSRNIEMVQENDQMIIKIEKEGKPGEFRKIKPKDHVWGACAGGHVFLIKSNVFFEMTRQTDGQFEFEGYDVDKVSQNALLGGIAFGVLGSVIAASTTKKNSIDTMILDLETGQYWPKKD